MKSAWMAGVVLILGTGLVGFSGWWILTNATPSQYEIVSGVSLVATPTPRAVSTPKPNQIKLQIVSPVDQEVVRGTSVVVKGLTESGVKIMANEASGSADVRGNFSVRVGVKTGENLITILAEDAQGKSSQTEVKVIVK